MVTRSGYLSLKGPGEKKKNHLTFAKPEFDKSLGTLCLPNVNGRLLVACLLNYRVPVGFKGLICLYFIKACFPKHLCVLLT